MSSQPKSDTAGGPGALTQACLVFSTRSSDIISCNTAAQELLGNEATMLQGRSCTEALSCDEAASSVLQRAAQARHPVPLPPFIIRAAGGLETVVSGVVFPGDGEAIHCTLLFWPLLAANELQSLGEISEADILAVLGVDHLHYSEEWGDFQTADFMLSVHASLKNIVRSRDSVGAPAATSIVLVLRDVDIEGASDISRAFLSHLHTVHTATGSAAEKVRISIGLAAHATETAVLRTLLAANNALELARRSSGEAVRAATQQDTGLLLGRDLGDSAFLGHVGSAVLTAAESERAAEKVSRQETPNLAPIETGIEGYVVDNMEGAVDQAIFMAKLDVPIAIIGPAGTGKMYIAKIVHDETGAAADMLVSIDCREFRSRNSANTHIARELRQGEGKTLVFKSPHLMNAEAQAKLARQISSRTLADASPAQYLPQLKLIGLFPDTLERLVKRGELSTALASAFAGYPISVPPIRDRKQAVLRWAHKILGQESASRDRTMKGFTPDAERAMLLYEWPGNISEMRQCIFSAVDKTDKDWLSPVDLGLYAGIDPEGAPHLPEAQAFLSVLQDSDTEPEYVASTVEALDVALGEAVHALLELQLDKPLGTWLEDDLVLATLDRYRNDVPRAADFLHTKARNVSRWLPKIESREEERSSSSLWQTPRRLLREWVRESPQSEESPLLLMQGKLMAHLTRQGGTLSAAKKARIMGVSTPTFAKRLQEMQLG